MATSKACGSLWRFSDVTTSLPRLQTPMPQLANLLRYSSNNLTICYLKTMQALISSTTVNLLPLYNYIFMNIYNNVGDSSRRNAKQHIEINFLTYIYSSALLIQVLS